jgi:hypothetical protein
MRVTWWLGGGQPLPGSPPKRRKARISGPLTEDGRYWARTSDPQLVELVLSQLS